MHYRAAVAADDFSRQDIEFHRLTAESYDREVTREYSVYHRYLLEPYLSRLAEQPGAARALDLGCGTGVVSLALANRGFDVLGIDHSPEMLALAEAKATGSSMNGHCRFSLGDVRALEADDGAFDVVTVQGLLHHLDDIEGCLSEINRVLRPGGAFYISEPCSDATPLKRALLALWHLRRLGSPPPPDEKPDSVEAPLVASELRAQLRRLGLQFELRFLTHLPPLQGALSERGYVRVVRLASFPWRRSRGDLLFVFGRKPDTAPPTAAG